MDLFFVISGFVLVWASWDAFGRWGAVAPFAARRLLRVVPLYWLLTAATITAGALLPGTLSEGLGEGSGYLAASLLFVPWRRADGFTQPILRLGWTLEYEMLFYALLAASLPLPRRFGLAALLAAIAALAALGEVFRFAPAPLAFWTDPIVLEFGMGASVAIAARQGWHAGWPGWATLAAVCAAGLVHWPGGGRVLVRGVPAALLVFCALEVRRVPAWLVLVGDASYALYLIHPFPMRAIRIAALRLGASSDAAAAGYCVLTLAVCVALAVALHRLVEQPILRWGRAAMAGPVEIAG